ALLHKYADAAFVEVAGSPDEVGLRQVVGTNRCRLGVACEVGGEDPGRVVVASAIDNLLKGAARQASHTLTLLLALSQATDLTGPQGLIDARTVALAAARQLGVPAESVLTASTGVIGHRLPVNKITAALPALVRGLSGEPTAAAEAILTTDTRVKMASRVLEI